MSVSAVKMSSSNELWGSKQDTNDVIRGSVITSCNTNSSSATGEPETLGYVGSLAEEDRRLMKEPVRAFEVFGEAARRGDARGQANLGLCYLHGNGVTSNSVEAVSWFRKAAMQSNVTGQINLGLSLSLIHI